MIAGDDRLRWDGDRIVVSLPAEIDLTNADEVRDALRVAARHGAAVLVIDMSATTFCDSAGVQVIIDAYNVIDTQNQTAATRTHVRLVATAVRRIFTLVGIDQLMPVYPSVEAALADLPA